LLPNLTADQAEATKLGIEIVKRLLFSCWWFTVPSMAFYSVLWLCWFSDRKHIWSVNEISLQQSPTVPFGRPSLGSSPEKVPLRQKWK